VGAVGRLGSRRQAVNDLASQYTEEISMPHLPARAFTFAVAFLVAAVAAVHFAPPASSQTGPGWTTLIDGTSIGDWDRVGETNWRLEDGAVVADQRTSKDVAHLVSKNSYKDFQLYVEF
jgi:Domain of Unknown Function (DUF1080)